MSAWDALLAHITAGLEDNRDGFNFATGLDLGLAIAIRHPEWAVAFRQSVQAQHSPKLHNTNGVADKVVEAVPIIVIDGEKGGAG